MPRREIHGTRPISQDLWHVVGGHRCVFRVASVLRVHGAVVLVAQAHVCRGAAAAVVNVSRGAAVAAAAAVAHVCRGVAAMDRRGAAVVVAVVAAARAYRAAT